MKNNVKNFGQFLNESGFGHHEMGDEMNRGGQAIHGISDLAIFTISGMTQSGKLYLVQADEAVDVDFPEDEISDEPEAWQEYVCGIARDNGANAVYFIDDQVIVKC